MMTPFRHEHLSETSSTNSVLLERAKSGEPEGLVLTADFQSHGRGKMDRIWSAPRGKNLLFSVLLRPPVTASHAAMLTQLSCQAVAASIEKLCALKADFKRPNDLMLKGKKICGILVESSSLGGKLDYAVIGIGLNVNALQNEIPENASSLAIETNREWDLNAVLEEILSQLRKKVEFFYKGNKNPK